jgi:hypothetical protein
MNEPQPGGPSGPKTALGELILVRLLAVGKPPTRSDFDTAFKRYYDSRLDLSGSAWGALLGQTLTDLEQRGLVEAKPFRLTDAGRRQAAAFLGLDAPPANAKWTALRDRHLIACALDIDPNDKDLLKKVGGSKEFWAAVLVKYFQLPGSPVPTQSQAKSMLAWQQLRKGHDIELSPTAKFTPDAVLKATLLKGQHVKDPVTLLATQVTKADNNNVNKVREAVIRRWLAEREAIGTPAPSPSQSVAHPSPPPFDLDAFAARVRELARTAPTGRFGDNKVFLSHVWNRFRESASAGGAGGNGMSRADFDRHLVEANRQNLLTLSRADLVSAMDPGDVAESEIRLPHSTFHFVRTDR